MNDEQLVVECIFVCGTLCTKPLFESGELTALANCGEWRWSDMVTGRSGC